MSTINITNARKDLYNLVEAVNKFHEPTLIVGKKANTVLISEDEWSAVYQVSEDVFFEDGKEFEGTVKVIRMWTHYEGVR